MIQDIAPHHFDNQYHPRPAEQEDYVLIFRKQQVYMREDGQLPRVKELIKEDQLRLQYLFQMDQSAYYTLLFEPLKLPEGYAFLMTRQLRTLSDHVIAMAVISGYQLWNWYETRMFCGSCGRSMIHDEKERMMRCDHCGTIEYPKICPAVIVGVIKDDQIILTRYAGRSFRKDALIAGFCEIGETLEETVRREVMEETGCTINEARYLFSLPNKYVFSGFEVPTTDCFFMCKIESGKSACANDDVAGLEWMAPEEITPERFGLASIRKGMALLIGKLKNNAAK